MALTDVVRVIVAVSFTAVLAVTAVSDVRSRRIPNWAVLALIGLFVVWAALDGGAGSLSALEAAGVALLVSVVLYGFKVMGAGDSKLFTAVALFAGLGYLPLLVVATTLAGGVIGLVSLASRPQRALVMFTLRGKGDWGRGIPYGVAIALGGALIVWAPMTGLVHPFGAARTVTSQDIAHLLGR